MPRYSLLLGSFQVQRKQSYSFMFWHYIFPILIEFREITTSHQSSFLLRHITYAEESRLLWKWGGMLLWDPIFSTRLHGFIDKKIEFFIARVAITSNLTWFRNSILLRVVLQYDVCSTRFIKSENTWSKHESLLSSSADRTRNFHYNFKRVGSKSILTVIQTFIATVALVACW